MLSYSLTSPTGQRTRHLWVSGLDLSAWCQEVSAFTDFPSMVQLLTFDHYQMGPFQAMKPKPLLVKQPNVTQAKMAYGMSPPWKCPWDLLIDGCQFLYTLVTNCLQLEPGPGPHLRNVGAEPEGETCFCSRGLALTFMIKGDWEDDIAVHATLVISYMHEIKQSWMLWI